MTKRDEAKKNKVTKKVQKEEIKMNNITKKLQNLVKNRKTPKVVIKQGSIKFTSGTSGSEGFSGDGYSEDFE